MKRFSFKKQLTYLNTLDWDGFVVKENRNTAENKLILLEMARNGEGKPKQGHYLYNAIGIYTNKNNASYYDPVFDKQIRKLRPDWFIHNVEENKKKLLLMAKNGENRPSKTLRQNLYNYTNKRKGGYDPVFDEQIRKLRPDWFVFSPQIVKQNKEKLLEMAKNGEDRPSSKNHPLGKILIHYTRLEDRNHCYDHNFDKQIKKLAPHWFVNQADIIKQNKQKLLDMAKNGDPRPENKLLNKYICKGSKQFDSNFLEEIKIIAPQWFLKKRDVKKNELLELARNGEPKPKQRQNHPLGHLLAILINKKSGDKEFNKQIRKLAPHWFISEHNAIGNKQKLLEMAKNGEDKPSNKLKSLLSNYLAKTGTSYDPIFDKEIRKLAPHWFIIIDKTLDKKNKLLEMARKGEKRPSKKIPLGSALCCYVQKRKRNDGYDPDFYEQIKKIAPHWFKI
jgi:hypothetical protein